MKRMSIATMVLSVMVACATESQTPDDRAETAAATAQDSLASPSPDDAPASTSVARTWRIDFDHENCVDELGARCTGKNASPACPAGIHNGSPCFVNPGTFCFQIIPPGIVFNGYQCF